MRVEAMDHYLDIQLLPDPEFSTPHLMNALFAKLHRILGARGSDDIGVSFPSVGGTVVGLGNCLRLHGSEQALRHLMAQRWLTGMRDHVRCGEVTLVPASAGRLTVRRVQAKSNPERLRRRQMKRKGWTPTGRDYRLGSRQLGPQGANNYLIWYFNLRCTNAGFEPSRILTIKSLILGFSMEPDS